MPTSENQIAANRANAAKSTGPNTPNGKRNAARNSTRHGILSSVVLIEGESRNSFAALLNSLIAEHQPTTPTETALVQKIAVSQWRLQRTWAFESAGINREIRLQSESLATESAADRAMLAFQTLGDRGRHLDLMGRYEHRFDRQHHRALLDLARLKEAKKTAGATRTQFSEQKKALTETVEAV